MQECTFSSNYYSIVVQSKILLYNTYVTKSIHITIIDMQIIERSSRLNAPYKGFFED